MCFRWITPNEKLEKMEALKWIRTVYHSAMLRCFVILFLLTVILGNYGYLASQTRAVAKQPHKSTTTRIITYLVCNTTRTGTTIAALTLPLVSTASLASWVAFPIFLAIIILFLVYLCILSSSKKVQMHHALWVVASGEHV